MIYEEYTLINTLKFTLMLEAKFGDDPLFVWMFKFYFYLLGSVKGGAIIFFWGRWGGCIKRFYFETNLYKKKSIIVPINDEKMLRILLSTKILNSWEILILEVQNKYRMDKSLTMFCLKNPENPSCIDLVHKSLQVGVLLRQTCQAFTGWL